MLLPLMRPLAVCQAMKARQGLPLTLQRVVQRTPVAGNYQAVVRGFHSVEWGDGAYELMQGWDSEATLPEANNWLEGTVHSFQEEATATKPFGFFSQPPSQ